MLNKYYLDEKYSDRDYIPYFNIGYNYIKDKKKILDIGSGVGNIVKFLNDNNHEAMGITINEDEIKNKKDNIILMDMHNLKFEDKFDAFIMWDVLEHSISPLTALKEANNILKDDGIGIIYIPSEKWIYCSYHILVPNLHQMLHLLRLSGFGIKEIYPLQEGSKIYIIEKFK
jgi:2-polyprenyl-3-methyl-5-hydroxy-6-metoxy-1,4-benzoquinol methylase